MNKVRQTQVASFKELQDVISNRQQSVYEALKSLGPSTNRSIAKHLGWDINRVTGRVNELVNLGMVNTNKTILDQETNRTVTLWKISK
jgi:DNA-binding MarR family transcriptional regulator